MARTLAAAVRRSYAGNMFVEGTLRWQVTEDCPWDLLMALCLRDLGGLDEVGSPALPAVIPAVQPVQSRLHPADSTIAPGGRGARTGGAARAGTTGTPGTGGAGKEGEEGVGAQWSAWWERSVRRQLRPVVSDLRPPHFAAFDRLLELQDLICDHYETARAWSEQRYAEYLRTRAQRHALHTADIVGVVREREHELRRQAGYFRLDLYVLPLAVSGTWVVAPNTVVVSQSLRFDSPAFRAWFTPVVAALV